MDTGTIVLLGIAIENATFTFLNGSIFLKLRQWLGKVPFFAAMLSCFLCTSFWVTVFILSLYGYCSYKEPIILILALHGVARYIQTAHYYLETGSMTTIPVTKAKVRYED